MYKVITISMGRKRCYESGEYSLAFGGCFMQRKTIMECAYLPGF